MHQEIGTTHHAQLAALKLNITMVFSNARFMAHWNIHPTGKTTLHTAFIHTKLHNIIHAYAQV